MPTLDHIAAATEDPNLQLTLKVLPALVVVLLAAGVCGRLALMVGQPRVLGEMVAGVLLGPTLFGQVWPDAQEAVFPAEVRPVLYVLSTIGLTLYMFLVGAGLDHGARTPGEGRRAPLLAASGMLPSVLLGFAAGLALWGTLSRPDVGRWEFALFVGGALSLTAFPMLARILYERGLENSPLGRLSLLAASIDDAAAWCLLAVLSALHLGTGLDGALRTIALAGLFAGVMLLVVARLLRPLGRDVVRRGGFGATATYVVVLVPLTAGYITDLIGVYSVFGGFVAGLAMPRDAKFREALHARMMGVVSTLLLPVFFAFSGLNTELGGLAGGTLLLAFLVIMAAGFCGKYFGCALAMRGLGFRWRESYAVGALMNARGLMILIFINIGLAQGMITRELFAMLVLVAVITTASAVPLYRLALPERLEPVREADPEPVPNAAA
ncbi:Kef-type K+ transport system, membrane component KefB [Actinomadura madurae]|uniref:Kef-type K+ transport system, membrane component KefB n=1 Tax=Actinomadura madurae TaxID=1993 RepID=A0A1I5J641_9ACTN|nr:cation:proton antiporter [Actinomadura madurae]SFO68073.1 Kef-type K+ transport system, membrane component KefB [Actinomadura madurae]